jgi:hypothetical protein
MRQTRQAILMNIFPDVNINLWSPSNHDTPCASFGTPFAESGLKFEHRCRWGKVCNDAANM